MDKEASRDAIGAILSQEQDGHEKVIAYASRTLSKSERSYCVTKKELLAVVHFVKGFRHFLEGRQFRLRTDHSSLRWLIKLINTEGQLARWLEVLSSYDMLIEHRLGAQHQNADAFSRIPCKQCGFFSLWDQEEMPGSVNTITKSEEETKLPDDISLKSIQKQEAQAPHRSPEQLLP